MNKLIKDQTGASSVLIIVMMTVLIVFGLAILSTAHVNLKLADKKIDWLSDYYALQDDAMQDIAKIDSIVKADTSDNVNDSLIEKITQELGDNLLTIERKAQTANVLQVDFQRQYGSNNQQKNIAISLEIHYSTSGQRKVLITQFKQYQNEFEFENIFDLE